MPKNSQRIEVFFSSPSDLLKERRIAIEILSQVNQDIGSIEGFHLIPVTWEQNTFSAIGDYPQDVVNRQIGSNYDIFVGMMANRYGSQTPKYGSGTEEEFELALERNQRVGSPEIAFFFSDIPKKVSEINLEDQLKIAALRARVGSVGILYKTFADETQFRLELWRTLVGASRSVMSKVPSENTIIESPLAEAIFDPLASFQALLTSDSEVHAMLLAQEAVERMQKSNRHLQSITAVFLKLTAVMSRQTERLKKSAQLNSEVIEAARAKVLSANREACGDLLRILPLMHSDLQEALVATQRSFGIFNARQEITKEVVSPMIFSLKTMRESARMLSMSARSARDQLLDGQTSTSDFQVRVLASLMLDTALIVEAGIYSMDSLEVYLNSLLIPASK